MRCSSFRNSICRDGDSADFGLVENEDALALAALLEEPQEAFAVGVGEKVGRRRAALRVAVVVERDLVQVARHREEAFGSKEPAIGDLRQPARAQCLRQPPAHGLDGGGVIDRHVALAAAGFVVAGERGDPFQERRLAGAVLAHDDGDGAVEAELEVLCQERQAEWISRGVLDQRAVEPHPPQIRRRKIDDTTALPGHASLARSIATNPTCEAAADEYTRIGCRWHCCEADAGCVRQSFTPVGRRDGSRVRGRGAEADAESLGWQRVQLSRRGGFAAGAGRR